MCVRIVIESVWTGLDRRWRAGCRSTLLLGRAERQSIACLEELRLLQEEVTSSGGSRSGSSQTADDVVFQSPPLQAVCWLK